MINWGKRCGQILAERADIKKTNIIERTALWYRLERIGQECSENGTPEPKHITTIYTHLGIDKKALELQKRIVSLEEEIKKLRTYAGKKRMPKY